MTPETIDEAIDLEVYGLLVKAQAQFAAPKLSKTGHTGKNGARTYKYAGIDDVLNAIRKPLNDCGLFLSQSTHAAEGGKLYVSTGVYYNGKYFELDKEFYEYDRNPQDFGARETYARRYSLNKAFALAGEEDTDGYVAQQAPKPARQATKPDRRKVMLAKIAKLKMECMQNGVREEGINDYMLATFGTDDLEQLTDKAVESLGKYLKQMAEDSAAMKEQSDVD